jgi:hypothetical protein
MTLNEIKEHNVTDRESEMMELFVDSLSDMDYGLNRETGEYTLPAIEWDGMYGKHWEYFSTEEERSARLARHSKECIESLPEIRNIIRETEEAKRNAGVEKGKKKRALKVAKTLGGQHPELGELLVKFRNEYKKSA